MRHQKVRPRSSRLANVSEEDPDAFEDFYERALPGAIRLAHLLTGSVSTGQDIAQDAMLVMHGRWEQIDDPPAYLRATVVNLCRSFQRRSIRERLHLRGQSEAVTNIPELDETWRELRRLSSSQRAVVVLRFYEDMSLAEIAEQLNWPIGSVKSTLHRALSKLQEVLP